MVENPQDTMFRAVQEASLHWQLAFNAGDAAGCAGLYEDSAVMHARPFGTFSGRDEIQGFWRKLIDDGFENVEYLNPKIEILSETTAVLTGAWKMNKAQGVIHKELWVMQPDGTTRLREDDFEAKN